MSWNTGATIATYITLEDLNKAASTLDVQYHATPVLKLVSEARAKGYNMLCLPITTDKWKQRWTEMCIQSSELEEHERDLVVERRTEEWRARPAFLKDEVTMTRLGQSRHQF
jgi:protein arginine N-methyltransferase 5